MENYKREFIEILNEAMVHFDPSIEDDVSIITVIADVDNNQLIFGGLKLRDDLEEEGEYGSESQVFYTAESKYLKDCMTINKDYKASDLFKTMSEAIDANGDLQEKLDGILLYGWCRASRKMIDVDNFWAS